MRAWYSYNRNMIYWEEGRCGIMMEKRD